MKKITKNVLLSFFLGLFALSNVLVLIPANVALATDKVNLCHKNGQSENWNALEVSENAWQEDNGPSHSGHDDDYLVPLEDLTEFLALGNKDRDDWCKENAPEDESPTPPTPISCPFDQMEGRTIVEFDKEWLSDNPSASNYSTDVESVNLPAGTYSVSLASWDGYLDRINSNQPAEQIIAIALNGSDVVSETDPTSDLADNVLEDSWSGVVNANLVLNQNVDGVKAQHVEVANYELDSHPNSVYPICASFDLIEEKEEVANLVATKILCDDEADLPNWGAGGPDVTSSTVSDFLALKGDKCRIIDWDFEWSLDGVGNPGDNVTSGGDGWNTFSSTETAVIPAGQKIWVREQINDNYVSFTGENTTENVSAELYCHTDVLHYDNWDWVNPVVADETYYCVGFNAPKNMCSVVSDTTNIVEDGVAAVETWNHGNWYDETLLGGAAKWIWETLNIVDPVGETTKVFVKEFNLDSIPGYAYIEVAADNSFVLEVNGDEVANETGDNNYGATKTYQVTNLSSGTNTIRMTVTNKAQANGTETSNPAGALYKLTVLGSGDCSDVTPTDMCLNIDGHQSIIPEGLEQDNEGNCVEPGPGLICDPEVNLLANGGFEEPVVTNSKKWDTFPNGTAGLEWFVEWISGGAGALELQAGVNSWLPNEGNQYAELDSTNATRIWQDIPTISGKTYKLEFDYSPRPKVVDNGIEVYGDGVLLDTLLADGSSNSNTSWSTKTYTFTADDEAKIEFKDISNSDSYGGFLDNVGLFCQNEPEEPKTGTVKICKLDSQENPLEEWQLMLLGDKVGETDVLPDGNDYTISSIPSGDYVVIANGQYTYRGTVGAEYSDAAYSKRAPTDSSYLAASLDPTQSTYLPWVRVNSFLNHIGWLGITMNNSYTDWGSVFNPNHIYALGTTTVGQDLSFKILDDVYSDNKGKINVEVYNGYTGITGEDGCVTFENVPYGTYSADEILKDGWENVSGLGEVIVDESEEIFNIMNRDTNIPDEPFLRSAEITNPSDSEDVSGTVSFTANLIDKDNDDSVEWAVRKGTCAAGTGTVFGNVDGYSDSYSWDNVNFEATTDVSSWENGIYCFVFNPSETTGDTPIRETVEFNVANPIVGPTYQCSDGIDNDGDSWVDYPADEGCSSATDDDETNQEETINENIVVKSENLAANISEVISDVSKWFFYNDETDVIDNNLGSFVSGPETAPIGNGSAEMSVVGTQRRNISTYQFKNVKLADITELKFSTYSQLAGDGANGLSERAPYLNFNVDFDNSDTWQRRLIFVPGQNGVVVSDTWQEWDAINSGNALWAYSGPTWPTTTDSGTTLKTWNQILALYPNAETRSTDSWFGFRVGEPYANGFTGNIDKFVIGIKNGLITTVKTFDFEPTVEVTILGCTDDDYDNYNPNATEDDGSCADNPTRRISSGSYVSGSVLGAFSTGGKVLGAEASCGIYVDKYIRRGYQNDPETVKKIQRFLNNYMGSNLTEDGIFGLKTEKAVMAFQEKHKDDVLTPWGLKGPTGIFYITTQTKVNNIMCPELNLQIPTLIPFEFNPISPNKA